MGRWGWTSALAAWTGLQDRAVRSAQVENGGLGPVKDEAVPKAVRRKLVLLDSVPSKIKSNSHSTVSGKRLRSMLFLGISEEKKKRIL